MPCAGLFKEEREEKGEMGRNDANAPNELRYRRYE
jgi:hypothetical protein